MFERWGFFVARHRLAIVIIGAVFTVFAGVWGTGAFGKLQGDADLTDPTSESIAATNLINSEIGRQSIDLVAVYSSDTMAVDDPAFAGAVQRTIADVTALPGVAAVADYWSTGSPSFLATDGRGTFVTVRLDTGTRDSAAETVRDTLRSAEGVTTVVGGSRAVSLDIDDRVGPDIARAEMISMPILLILLLLLFGNVVAACMPLVIGTVAILGAFTVVRVITSFTDVSIFSINIITILGLGLAVDYGLFVVSRFREELARGRTTEEAVARTMAGAGRTVLVSGLLVGLSLCSLLIFPQVLLRSMGFGGAAAVLVAMITSLTVLPAVLAMLGSKVDAAPLPWVKRRRAAVAAGTVPPPDHRRWARFAEAVMRRPALCAISVVVVLVVLALPFLRVQFGGIDERMLPPGTESLVAAEELATDFPAGTTSQPINIYLGGATEQQAQAFAAQVGTVPGAQEVTITAQQGTSFLIRSGYTGEASSVQARDVVAGIRDLPPPDGTTLLVGGTSASVLDQLDSIAQRLPWMALLVGVLTFLFLAFAFRSVLVPIKAIVMNVVSIGASFGVVTWIFQDGHLSGFLNFTPTGYVEASQPVLMVAILFGLSMDYEVFLLSRIRENRDNGHDNATSVSLGVQQTGRIITAAAALLCVVVGAFSLSGITFLKMIGVGILVALIIDATLVRLVLVPATMKLLGAANWWAPGFLARSKGLGHESAADDAPEPARGAPQDSGSTDATTGVAAAGAMTGAPAADGPVDPADTPSPGRSDVTV
ncbi:MMPL family transporter [Nakamurella alba]|uniref:MMPL family transporter n=1 Tax=Nakamurella alba TaxID=2665158 RepID=UPI0012BA0043|nr:MMPL family transporter [Nakamurella alba]